MQDPDYKHDLRKYGIQVANKRRQLRKMKRHVCANCHTKTMCDICEYSKV